MKKNYTHNTFVVDRSGSMSSLKEDVIGGYNETIKKQKAQPGELTVSFIQFDNEYETVFDFANITSVEDLTDKTYVPRGSTALLDSLVKAINQTGKRLAEMKEEDRPSKVIVTVITDGYENASIEQTKKAVSTLIKHQEEKYNWEFVYIGANQDAFAEGSSMGFANNVNYKASKGGTKALFSTYNDSLSRVRYRVSSDDFSEKERSFSLSQADLDKETAKEETK